MKDFHKDFTNKEKRELRKEFDNSSEVRKLRKELEKTRSDSFLFLTFFALYGFPKLDDSKTNLILFIAFSLLFVLYFIQIIIESNKLGKAHLEDYTKWLKEKDIKY